MAFNLNDYEPVAARLARWLSDAHDREADPRVITHLVHHGPGWCVFRAELYEGDILRATGWAEEHATDRGVNATSHVENCETSAVGRALANMGVAGHDPDRRPSQEEMRKVKAGELAAIRTQMAPTAPEDPSGPADTGQPSYNRETPTDKMVKFLRVLEKRKGVKADSAAEQDFDLCRSEIDRLQGLPDA
jgi:hypothetical protein